ncbi:hypothetical protein [Methylobacterium sp. Leaf117]|uniref:hypothetical protein n=1 Tax=Methylobacterium sp. Leaf117 TaxID=1736260 RepID=UPI0007290636|nr:hypothetical protein [Methylobacterium sp. Leaf117]KQP80325.1 hypothetical protein ASF57_18265 [Methylobacterium sp. Leaf117]
MASNSQTARTRERDRHLRSLDVKSDRRRRLLGDASRRRVLIPGWAERSVQAIDADMPDLATDEYLDACRLLDPGFDDIDAPAGIGLGRWLGCTAAFAAVAEDEEDA